MAGLQGLAGGFLQGYGFVSDIQDRNRRRDLQEKRFGLQQQEAADNRAYRDKRVGLLVDKFDYQQEQDVLDRQAADRKFEHDQAYDRARLGIAGRRADAAIAASHASTELDEIKAAEARRSIREQKRRRTLEAAIQELSSNGVTPRFRSLAKESDVPIDDFVDESWVRDKDTVIAGLQGAPIKRSEMVRATGRVFQDKIDKVIGEETTDGRTIVRAALDGIYPGEDGDDAMLDLKLWAKDKDGKVSEYKAPVTPNRSARDNYVHRIPLNKALGYLKGLDVAEKATDKEQLRSVIAQEMTRSGADDASNDTEWRKLSETKLYEQKSGQTKTIKPVPDENERYSKALRYAQKDYESSIKNDREFRGKDEDDRNRWLRERRNMYLRLMKPDDAGDRAPQNASSRPARLSTKAEFDRLPSGARFIAPDGTTRIKP